MDYERIVGNIARASGEIGPSYARGIVQQFGTALPLDGPDSVVSVGLGLHYRNPEHRPFTPGFIPPTTTLRGGEVLSVAGLRVETSYAPSDADDFSDLLVPRNRGLRAEQRVAGGVQRVRDTRRGISQPTEHVARASIMCSR